MAILELTKENLIKYDFNSDVIERFLTWDNYEQTTQNNLGTFFASNIENKIYTGIEAHRKIYFRDKENPRFPFNALGLIPEYYDLAQSNFLENSKKRLTFIYNEQTEKQKFKESEIKKAIRVFKESEGKPGFNFNNNRFIAWNDYLNWLNNIDKQEQQSEPIDKSEPEDSRAKLKKSYLGLTYDQMDKSYTYFNNFLFKDLTFDEYLICFEQDKPIEKHPTFIYGNTIKFIKFLDGIQTVTINCKIAKDRFGIKNYKQSNSQGFGETKENIVFKSKIEAIYKLNDIKIC